MGDAEVIQVDPTQLLQTALRVGELPELIQADVQQPLQTASEAAMQGWQPGQAVYSYQQVVTKQLQQVDLLHQQIEEWSTLLAQQAQSYVRADTVGPGTSGYGPDTGEDELLRGGRNSVILANNMIKKGIPQPPGTAAHHIVPIDKQAPPSAKAARAILAGFTPPIDPNDADNGVFLPFDRTLYPGLKYYHQNVHTNKYCDTVLRRLQQVIAAGGGRADVVNELQQIGRELQACTFPV